MDGRTKRQCNIIAENKGNNIRNTLVYFLYFNEDGTSLLSKRLLDLSWTCLLLSFIDMSSISNMA